TVGQDGKTSFTMKKPGEAKAEKFDMGGIVSQIAAAAKDDFADETVRQGAQNLALILSSPTPDASYDFIVNSLLNYVGAPMNVPAAADIETVLASMQQGGATPQQIQKFLFLYDLIQKQQAAAAK